jgi:hypothetical protein|tara:strand:+ start:95 stop:670 length:576 start_codon:yes stop_codon:yes gene_type:complete
MVETPTHPSVSGLYIPDSLNRIGINTLCFEGADGLAGLVQENPQGHLREAMPGKPLIDYRGIPLGTEYLALDVATVTQAYDAMKFKSKDVAELFGRVLLGLEMEVLAVTAIRDDDERLYSNRYWVVVDSEGNLIPVEPKEPDLTNRLAEDYSCYSVGGLHIPTSTQLEVTGILGEWYGHQYLLELFKSSSR